MDSNFHAREAEAAQPPRKRLESWKEIATYLRRDVTTVQRWEKREALPVHRHQHDRQGAVFAFSHELDAWLHRRQLRPDNGPTLGSSEPASAPRLGRRALGGLAIAAAVLVAAAAAIVTVMAARSPSRADGRRWQVSNDYGRELAGWCDEGD